MTRRHFLAALPACARLGAAAVSEGQEHPGKTVFVRFLDRATENSVVRLTSDKANSVLPAPGNRFYASRRSLLFCASDAQGSWTILRTHLKSGATLEFPPVDKLDPLSLHVDSGQRELYFRASGRLWASSVDGSRPRALADAVDAFHVNGPRNTTVICHSGRLEYLAKPKPVVLATEVASSPLLSSSGTDCLFLRKHGENTQLWVTSVGQPRPRLLVEGNIRCPQWQPQSTAILYIRQVSNSEINLMRVDLADSREQTLAHTSQFAVFSPNGNGSVVVGSSYSRAQPDVTLLLTDLRRELVLAEHRAKDPFKVSPAFSPDGRRVFYASDQTGKWSIYVVDVERLVDETNS